MLRPVVFILCVTIVVSYNTHHIPPVHHPVPPVHHPVPPVHHPIPHVHHPVPHVPGHMVVPHGGKMEGGMGSGQGMGGGMGKRMIRSPPPFSRPTKRLLKRSPQAKLPLVIRRSIEPTTGRLGRDINPYPQYKSPLPY